MLDSVQLRPVLCVQLFLHPPLPLLLLPPPPRLALSLPLPFSHYYSFSLGSRLTIRYYRHVAVLCPACEHNTQVSAESLLWVSICATAIAFVRAVGFSASKQSNWFVTTCSINSCVGQ